MDMAVLGGVLGALLLLALICLVILVHKHYRHRFTCCSGKASVRKVGYWARYSRKGTNSGLRSHRKGTWRDEWEQVGKSGLYTGRKER